MCEGPAQDVCCTRRPSLCCLAPPLTLKPLMPVRCHKGFDAAIRVDSIEWLEIAGTERDSSDNTDYFIIDVFKKKEESRLPTSRLVHKPTLSHSVETMAKPTRTEPDFRIRRSFADFKKLSDDVMLAAQKQHVAFCHFCNEYHAVLIFTSTRPIMSFRPLLTMNMQARVVQRLLQDLVSLFQARQPTAGRRIGCEAVYDIPVILDAFVFESEP